MSEFINTIDMLGDEETVKAIIERTITEFNDNVCKSIGGSAFSGCSALTSVDLPNVTSTGSSAFSYCTALTSVDLPKLENASGFEFSDCTALEFVRLLKLNKISNNMFIRSPNLKTLILGASTVCSLPSTNSSGGMTNGCTVYVPQALIESYKTATNWSTLYAAGTCNFVAIEGSEYE